MARDGPSVSKRGSCREEDRLGKQQERGRQGGGRTGRSCFYGWRFIRCENENKGEKLEKHVTYGTS